MESTTDLWPTPFSTQLGPHRNKADGSPARVDQLWEYAPADGGGRKGTAGRRPAPKGVRAKAAADQSGVRDDGPPDIPDPRARRLEQCKSLHQSRVWRKPPPRKLLGLHGDHGRVVSATPTRFGLPRTGGKQRPRWMVAGRRLLPPSRSLRPGHRERPLSEIVGWARRTAAG